MIQTKLFEEPSIDEKKDALLDSVAATRNPEQQAELAYVMGALSWYALKNYQTFTSSDVRERVEDQLGRPMAHPNMIGIAFHKMAKIRRIRKVGYQQSRTPSRHGALVRVWRGAP
jgi:hypothetical protein